AIRKELDSELSILDVFDCPSIELLALKLAGISAPSPIGILHKQDRPDRIPLSYSQERLWFIDQLEGSVQYH
uniref:hypothetical protein n=1 Tax=Dyadobacter sp. OTU695 TaxID=3043860 RepID=UPI00313DA982